eukprot:TRINITY_DN33765_c0_g1_i1.p1 TRINITY_DN33765_c0_g1~~TRINITY_DN33765_c0_g1_i1.p1  ORF type:complete len:104 (-),score=8.25 TRINITY_DN33765_c0_g1_i1:227-538(-)
MPNFIIPLFPMESLHEFHFEFLEREKEHPKWEQERPVRFFFSMVKSSNKFITGKGTHQGCIIILTEEHAASLTYYCWLAAPTSLKTLIEKNGLDSPLLICISM